MSVSHSLTRGWAGQNGTPINPPVDTLTGSEELNFDFALNAATYNTQFNLAFTKTLLQSIYIYSNAANVTLKTNSASAPQDTISLVAGVPLAWDVYCALANPFANNVNTCYVSNGTAINANISVRCLTNG